jgi:ribulose-5-phosphate 4-epimerase/fuculose-1-phosphate aldolase
LKSLNRLKIQFAKANLDLVKFGLVTLTWGKDADDSVKNSLVLERVSEMTYASMQLNPTIEPLPKYITDKHYNRKHGPNAYYGQK